MLSERKGSYNKLALRLIRQATNSRAGRIRRRLDWETVTHLVCCLADRDITLQQSRSNDQPDAYQLYVKELCNARTLASDCAVQAFDKRLKFEHLLQHLAIPSIRYIRPIFACGHMTFQRPQGSHHNA